VLKQTKDKVNERTIGQTTFLMDVNTKILELISTLNQDLSSISAETVFANIVPQPDEHLGIAVDIPSVIPESIQKISLSAMEITKHIVENPLVIRESLEKVEKFIIGTGTTEDIQVRKNMFCALDV
jgi:hypothetical protein